jgi:hypothetical protein
MVSRRALDPATGLGRHRLTSLMAFDRERV